jgi:hypothetical protein
LFLSGEQLGRYAFFCPNCRKAWSTEVKVLEKGGADHLYLTDPEEEPEPDPPESFQSIIGNIEKQGTLFEHGGFAVTSDGAWHFFLTGRVLIGPLCDDNVREAETPTEMPHDALICRKCVERVRVENDLRKAARRAKR